MLCLSHLSAQSVTNVTFAGNYKHAHDLLLGMCRELMRQRLPVPGDMAAALLLLHSYTLARLCVKRGDHPTAARLLVRVSNSISKFPARECRQTRPRIGSGFDDIMNKVLMEII